MVEFNKNQKGQDSAVLDGYIFNLEKGPNKAGISNWKCRKYYARGDRCSNRIHKRIENLVEEFSEHNHPPSAAELELLKTRSTIRKRAAASRDPPSLMIAEATAALLDLEPRTNNAVEGWHQGLKATITGDHPSMWPFLSGLQAQKQLLSFELSMHATY